MEMEKRAFVTLSDETMRVHTDVATRQDIRDLVTQCFSAKKHWFKIVYDVDAEIFYIHPRDFLNARSYPPERRRRFINRTIEDLRLADNITVHMINPDKPDARNLY